MIVMFADTDAGSLITAAQSGAIWGYRLVLLQLLLIPVLYLVQEITIRLGLTTGKGCIELIREHFGKYASFLSVLVLCVCCIGALISELSGIAEVGLLFGVPNWFSLGLTTLFLIWLVWSRSYHSVERVALAIGAFELIYFFVAWQSHPQTSEILNSFKSFPLTNANFLYLIAANIGAVIMPWMIFYQQSALIDKKLHINHIGPARLETLIGAFITQLIMAAVVVAVAATIGRTSPGASLDTIRQISYSIIPFVGINTGKILFGLGMLGACLIATIVVSLTAAWSIGEALGVKRSLQDDPKDAPWFYGFYAVILILASILVSSNIHLVNLNVAIEVMNALLLPVILFFIFKLAWKKIPEQYRLKGKYLLLVATVFLFISFFSLFASIWGILG
jgi:Mn2+/Fe2+ NRAMP family transporter